MDGGEVVIWSEGLYCSCAYGVDERLISGNIRQGANVEKKK